MLSVALRLDHRHRPDGPVQLHQGHDHASTICGFSPALGRDSVLRVQTAVLIAGDPLMVEALNAGLAGQDDLHLVGTATSGSQALAIAETRRVDVAVIDTELGREDGIHVGRMLREVSPATNVIHLSGLADDVGRVTAALQDGVRGWVGKDESVQALLAALRGVQHGETRLPPALLTQVLGRLTPGQPGPLDMLSSRQREVLQGLVDGLSRAAIGERLFVSKNTVRTHIQQLLGRLGAHSVLEAVAMAREAGMRAQSTPALPAGHPGAWPRAATSQAS